MPRAFRFLLIFCVLWCGSHGGEAAQAHEDVAYEQVAEMTDASSADPEGAGENSAKVSHTLQHHCPVAAPQGLALSTCDAVAGVALLFPATVATLTSRAQAPPLEPPTA